MTNWEEVKNEWENSKITLATLAEKHDIPLGTLKSKKSRDKQDGNEWMREKAKRVATQLKKDATEEGRMQPEKVEHDKIIHNTELTEKQILFCIYYIKYFNATKAYQKAYGCDYESAMRSGSRLMRKVEISKEIDRMRAEQLKRKKVSADDILQRLIDIAFADITDFVKFGKKEIEVMDDYGDVKKIEVNYVDFKDSEEVDGTIISEVRQGKDGVSVKLVDKMRALEKLAEYVDFTGTEEFKRHIEEEKLKVRQAQAAIEDDKKQAAEDWTEALKRVAKKRGELNAEK